MSFFLLKSRSLCDTIFKIKITEVIILENQNITPEKAPITWDAFVRGDVVNFFADCKLEKMTVDDGDGNKAKLSRTKENEIKIEISSTSLV